MSSTLYHLYMISSHAQNPLADWFLRFGGVQSDRLSCIYKLFVIDMNWILGGRILELEGGSERESCSKIAILTSYDRPGVILGGQKNPLDPRPG